MENCDILIIGAGAAGIAAAKSAWESGCRSVLLVDRKKEMGGVLLQCAHHGFGKDLDGPEYTAKLLENFPNGVEFLPEVTVLKVNLDKTATLSGKNVGKMEISFRQLILATGCREIPVGALPIGGTRPEGVYTAGYAQELLNLHGIVPEGPVVILGSGDLGLVMAKHLAERDIPVTLVEQRESCGGMAKNQRCLTEFPIELLCGTTISEVLGEKRLEAVRTADGRYLPCRTLLIAAGLRPEQQLARNLGNPPWLHICGNASKVHPMVEAVVNEGKQAGRSAWENCSKGQLASLFEGGGTA